MTVNSVDLTNALKCGVLDKNILEQIPGCRRSDAKGSGPKVVIECAQNIPCNPCETSCPQGAIKVGEPITNLPVVDIEKCIGCGICVAACPGLAIFLVDNTSSEEYATVTFAYEYLPVPAKGDIVTATDREGKAVCEATVEKVISTPGYDMTKVITIKFPKKFADDVRAIAWKRGE